MTTLKITVTKEILEKSKMCAPNTDILPTTNCAVALAVRDIFPFASVSRESIHPFLHDEKSDFCECEIRLPWQAKDFIHTFDHVSKDERSLLPELFFEIEIPDAIIEKINIEELRPLLENHPTLEFV